MATEDNIVIPNITIDESVLDSIRQQLDVVDVPSDDVPETPIQPPVKRRRGRPRKYPVSQTGTTVPELQAEEDARVAALEGKEPKEGTPLPPAKLGKRDEREVAERITNILIGGTGIASQAKSYLAMTEDEAKAIADPLSAYLVRNADTIPVAQQVLENYDLLAIVLGVLAYTVRVYRDRTNELEEQRANNAVPNSSTLDRIREFTSPNSAGQENGYDGPISTPYG